MVHKRRQSWCATSARLIIIKILLTKNWDSVMLEGTESGKVDTWDGTEISSCLHLRNTEIGV